MTAFRGSTTGRGTTPDLVAPPALERTLLTPTTVAFAAVAVAFGGLDLLRVDVPFAVQVVPFAISVVLLGLPHGALDHLVPARTDPRVGVLRSVIAVVALYALLGSATALLWIAAPAAGFGAFIAVTWFHWGQGDLWIDRAVRGASGSRPDALLTLLVRGALPMLLPLIAHPADYAAVFRMTTRLVDPAPDGGAALHSAALRIGAAVLLVALVVVHLLLRRRSGERTGRDAAEVAVLAAFFVAVPPVLAVGLYFTFWHAVRHIVRLELADGESRAALERGDLLPPFLHFLRDALPVTTCAIALLVALALTLRDAGLGTYLLLIAALTTPHTAVVTWMDARRRTGRCGGRRAA